MKLQSEDEAFLAPLLLMPGNQSHLIFKTFIKWEAISTDMTEVALWVPPPIKQFKKSIRLKSELNLKHISSKILTGPKVT